MGEGFWEQLLIGFMMLVLPWIFVAVGGFLLWQAHNFMKVAQRMRGTVIAVHTRTSTSSSNGSRRTTVSYQPVFEYVDQDGLSQRAETFLSSSSYNYDIGEEREILVDPANPGKVRIPGIMVYGFGAIFLVMGLIFGVVGYFAYTSGSM